VSGGPEIWASAVVATRGLRLPLLLAGAAVELPLSKLATEPQPNYTETMRPPKFLAFALLPALIAGCTTVGKPYPFPHDGEPSAQVEIRGTGVYLLTLNEKGCYTGKTRVDHGPGAPPIDVVPDAPLYLSYEENVCMMPVRFTPQKGMKYRLIAAEGPKLPDADASFFEILREVHQRQCVVGVMEVDADDKPVKPVKVTALRPHQAGITCIRFR